MEATGWAILINAVSYVAVIASLLRLDTTLLRPSTPAERGRGGIRVGITYVRGRPDLMLVLATVFFVGTFGMNFQMTSALMATEVFGKGVSEYGVLGSFMAVGSLTGALVAARRAAPRVRTVVGGAGVFSVLLITMGLMPTYWTYAAVLPFAGLFALTMVTTANATIQLTVAPEMRGRVAALYLMIFMGGTPIGAPLIGLIGEVLGARWTLIGGGVITLAGLAVSLLLYLRHTGSVISQDENQRFALTVTARA